LSSVADVTTKNRWRFLETWNEIFRKKNFWQLVVVSVNSGSKAYKQCIVLTAHITVYLLMIYAYKHTKQWKIHVQNFVRCAHETLKNSSGTKNPLAESFLGLHLALYAGEGKQVCQRTVRILIKKYLCVLSRHFSPTFL